MLEIKSYKTEVVKFKIVQKKKTKKSSENKFLLIQFCHGLSFKKEYLTFITVILITFSKGTDSFSHSKLKVWE